MERILNYSYIKEKINNFIWQDAKPMIDVLLNIEDVRKVFNHHQITEEMIKKLNPDRNIK